MSELDEIMEGKHEIKHLHIEGDTIAFETELDNHTWNLSPRDIEIIIYCLQKENNKQKEVLDKIKEIFKDYGDKEDISGITMYYISGESLIHILELLEEIDSETRK
jgi:hypothetical protein